MPTLRCKGIIILPNGEKKPCRKKLNSLMPEMSRCRCGMNFCPEHMHTHECNIDYRQEFAENTKLEAVIAPKVQVL